MLTDKKLNSKGVIAYDSIDITSSKWQNDSDGEWVDGWEAEDWGGCDCEGAAQAFFSYCEGRVLYSDYNVVAQTYLCYNVSQNRTVKKKKKKVNA